MANNAKRIHTVILFSAVLALFVGFTPNMTPMAFADNDEHSQHIKNNSFEVPKVKKGKWNAFPESNQLKWDVKWRDGSCAGHPEPLLEIQNNVRGLGGAKDKKQHAELDSHCPTIISQKINTHEDRKYILEFYSKQRPNTNDDTNGLRVLIDGDEVINISDMSRNWEKSTHEFKGTGGFIEITFEDTGIADSLGTFLDKVQVKSEKIDDDDILKWVVKILKGIMIGDIEWVHWDSLKDDTIPVGLLDGDDDTLGTIALTCERGDVVKLDGTNQWVCADDLDTLGSLTCAEGEIAVFSSGVWSCGTGGGGAGDVEAVFAGTGLTGGGISGEITLDVDGSQVALLNQNNDFTGDVTVGGSLIVDTFDFDTSDPNFICTDSSGCMPGSVIKESSITGSKIVPGTFSLNVVPKTIELDLSSLGQEIPPLSSDSFTVSCDSSTEQITGFGVALPNDEAPISFTSVFVDDTQRDTLEIEVVNQNPEWVYDPSDPEAETPSLNISALDITIFCTSVSLFP